MHRSQTISGTTLRYCVVVGLTLALPLASAWLLHFYYTSMTDIRGFQGRYMRAQKRQLKSQVDNAIGFINFKRSQVTGRVKESIRVRTSEAHAIATDLYERYKASLSRDEIRALVREVLRSIRFSNGRGYYFVVSLDGTIVLSPSRPDHEGKNMLGLQDSQGAFVIRDMIDAVRAQGEGFCSYRWPKLGSGEQDFCKISFVKFFEPFGWIIGAGEYLDAMEKQLQQEALEWLGRVRFGKDGYLFAGQWDGRSLLGPARGRTMAGVADLTGANVVQKLIACAKGGGGFVRYFMPAVEGQRPDLELSYARGVIEWGWYVGAGASIGDLEAEVEAAKHAMMRRMSWQGAGILSFLFGLVIVGQFMARRMGAQMESAFDVFAVFFQKAASQSAQIDLDVLEFREFRSLARAANRMIEQRHHAEVALRESEERFRSIVQHLSDIVWVVDRDSVILYETPSSPRVLGAAPGGLVGKRLLDMVHPDDLATASEAFDEVLRKENPYQPTGYRMRHADGHWVRLESIASNMLDHPALRGIVVVSRDVTERWEAEQERRRLEDALLQSEKMRAIGQLAGGIAHDFNNLLTGILGYANMLKLGLPPGTSEHHAAKTIEKAAERAADLTGQLLGFARRGKNRVAAVDVHETLQEVVQLLSRSFDRNIRIRLDLHAGRPVTMGDPNQLQQVFLNLMMNARDAMPDGGELAIQTDMVDLDDAFCRNHAGCAPGTYVKASVADTGHGIPSEHIERLFEPFFTTKKQGQGTGMGLAMVYGILADHGGAIDVASQVGVGTTVTVYLPASAQDPDAEAPPAAQDLAFGTGHVLLVDDEEVVREVAEDMLRSLGYEVTCAADGREAVELYRERGDGFDAVILDMVMPEMGGAEAFAELRRLDPGVRVVLSTGFGDSDRAQDLLDQGVAAFVPKPYRMDQLAATVARVLRGDAAG